MFKIKLKKKEGFEGFKNPTLLYNAETEDYLSISYKEGLGNKFPHEVVVIKSGVKNRYYNCLRYENKHEKLVELTGLFMKRGYRYI